MQPSKTCKVCGATFYKKEKHKQWKMTKCCSHECASLGQINNKEVLAKFMSGTLMDEIEKYQDQGLSITSIAIRMSVSHRTLARLMSRAIGCKLDDREQVLSKTEKSNQARGLLNTPLGIKPGFNYGPPQTCRWILGATANRTGQPAGDQTQFCCEPTIMRSDGNRSSYCAEHHRFCFTPVRPSNPETVRPLRR